MPIVGLTQMDCACKWSAMLSARAGTPRRSALMLYAAAYAGGATLQKGLGFVLFMWLAHSLSVEQYARFGLFYALQTGLAAFAIAGIAEAVVGMLKEHVDPDARRELFASANGIFGLLALLAAGGALIVLVLMGPGIGASWADIACVTVAALVTAFFTLQSLLTRLNERHDASLWLSFLPPLAGLLAGLCFFLAAPGVSMFYAGMAGGLLLMVPACRLAGMRLDGFRIGGTVFRDALGRLAPFMLIVALAWLSGYGNTYLVQALFEASDVARFTFAYTLASIMQLLASSLNQVWAPKFFRLVHEVPAREIELGNRRFYRLLGLLLGTVGALVLVVGPIAVRLVGASLAPYAGLEYPLFFLFAAYAVSIPWWHVQNYYLVHSKGRELMFVIIGTSVIGLLAWVAAMSMLGNIGVYVGFALMMLIRSAGAFACARRLWPVLLMWEGTLIALGLLGAGALLALQLR